MLTGNRVGTNSKFFSKLVRTDQKFHLIQVHLHPNLSLPTKETENHNLHRIQIPLNPSPLCPTSCGIYKTINLCRDLFTQPDGNKITR